MTVWKVLTKDRKSITAKGSLQVHYPVGETVVAPTGGLLAFKTRKTAQKFAEQQWSGWHFITVRAIAEEEVPLPRYRFCEVSNKEFVGLLWNKWACEDLQGWGGVESSWPTGTVAFRQITCLT